MIDPQSPNDSTSAEKNFDETLSVRVSLAHCDRRFDQVAAELFPQYSRARLQSWIKSGLLRINHAQAKPKDKLTGDELLSLMIQPKPEVPHWLPEPIDFPVIYDDESIIVINKPAGLVVHPGAGVKQGTLLNGLLHSFPELSGIPRAGIVHRLDKDTSGLMVVARSLVAHHALVKQLQARTVGREYQAVVMGELTGGGTVDAPIGRHPNQRTKMAVLKHHDSAKQAITHFRLVQRYPRYSHIYCRLETGRTHQIRVHMAHVRHPLVGDPLYNSYSHGYSGTSAELRETIRAFKRQALHASKLTLIHPQTQQHMCWETPLPEDIIELLDALNTEQKRMSINP